MIFLPFWCIKISSFIIFFCLENIFSHSFRVCLLPANFHGFSSSEKVDFSLHCWMIFSLYLEFWMDRTFPSAFGKCYFTPSGLHNFRWDICRYLTCFPIYGKCHFSLTVFKIFPFVFSLYKVYCGVSSCGFFTVHCVLIPSASSFCMFIHFVKFGKFWSLFLWIFFQLYPFSFFLESHKIITFVILPQVLADSAIFFQLIFTLCCLYSVISMALFSS